MSSRDGTRSIRIRIGNRKYSPEEYFLGLKEVGEDILELAFGLVDRDISKLEKGGKQKLEKIQWYRQFKKVLKDYLRERMETNGNSSLTK